MVGDRPRPGAWNIYASRVDPGVEAHLNLELLTST
jgi:hypothetical protein